MRLVPPLSSKRLSNAIPGELLSVRLGSAQTLCIKAEVPQHENRKILIVLAKDGLHYRIVNVESDNPLALSYGRGYEFRVGPPARNVTVPGPSFEQSGAILLESNRALLRVANRSGKELLYYDVTAGTADEHTGQSDLHVAVLDWTIAPAGAKEDAPRFYEFRAP